MAMTEKTNPTTKLNRRFVNLGGVLSIILAIAAIAIIAFGVFGDTSQPVDILAMGALWITFYAGVIIAGSSLLRGNRKALWALLVFWLLTTLGAVLVVFGWLIWDIEILPENIRTAGIGFLIVQFLGMIPITALLAATPPASRNRYGAMVGVSVAAAVAVVVVVNMFAAAHPVQKDCEMLNRFGLSEYAKKIIEGVDSPMTISAVYAAAASDADTEEELAIKTQTQNQLRRVMELLEEIHRANPKITVSNASSDAARARLTARLQKRQLAKTGPQQKLLQKILDTLPEIKEQITKAQSQWTQLPADSYLSQWNVGPKVADMLKLCSQGITNTERAIRQAKATSPLPDHVKMLDKIVDTLKNCQGVLDANIKLQKQLATIPPAVKANAPDAIKSVNAATNAINAMVKILDNDSVSAEKVDPAATLQKLIDALGQAGEKVNTARSRLDLLAGKNPENVMLLLKSKAWRIIVPTKLGNISITRSELFDNIAREIENRRTQCTMLLQNANTQAQGKFLVEVRGELVRLAKVMAANSTAVQAGMEKLQTIDPASGNLLNLAKSGKLFGNLISLITPMLDDAGKLKLPDDKSMPPDLTGQNIIVIETAPKVEVIPFAAVWPYRMSNESARQQKESKRFFNGDAAISSRVLGLTH
ncbi:MAG: hypothetical protein K8S55_15155, partial [Phycisphaerae bacterium]|nr:hypothetical protein [Phycisphaerae bacterium]